MKNYTRQEHLKNAWKVTDNSIKKKPDVKANTWKEASLYCTYSNISVSINQHFAVTVVY